MANWDHQKILKQGIEVWNKWRHENPNILPHLVGANLYSAHMSRVNLSRANLNNANLNSAILYRANLCDADLSAADLRHADLTGSDFSSAQLNSAKLGEAEVKFAVFTGAKLDGANFTRTKLKDANFRQASLINTNFNSADLRGAALIDSNLSGAKFDGADLRNADLSSATLSSTNLSNANLCNANFNSANLYGAILNGADLTGADLTSANLTGADFCTANLTGALLYKANLTGAILNRTNVDQAGVGRTVFANIDLREVEGLESISHQGPSEISINILSRSEGKIPEIFLRGTGLKDWEIQAAKLYRTDLSSNEIVELTYKIIELRSDPFLRFNSCFISYSSKDEDFARHLYSDLQNSGVRCWFAPENMKIGDRIRMRIDDSILLHDKLLLILSKESITSQWIEQEVETALEKEREQGYDVLFPIRVDDTVLNMRSGWPGLIKKTRHIGDFCRWEDSDKYQKGLKRLLADLRV